MALLNDQAPIVDGADAAAPVRILYIGGTGRTGSTLLERMLGQLPGVFNAGELTWLWYGLLGDGRCSCGERLAGCAVWEAIFERAYGGLDRVDVRETFELRRRGSSRYLPTMVVPAARRRLLARLEPLPERLELLYRGIQAATGSRLVVDASKEPHYSWILRSRPDLDVHFVHLVRDPRAIAFSWARVKPETGFDGRVLLERRGTVMSAVYHNVSNAAAEALWGWVPGRYLRVRYEDLMADPRGTVAAIGDFVGVDLDVGPLLEGSTAHLKATHSAWGNPNRFESGRIELRHDDEWRAALPARDRALTTALTLPFLRRYHYPVRAR
jgi:hypothetical protein